LHSEIVASTAALVAGQASASRVTDVGCGTGRLLTRLGALIPEADLCGVDAAPGMARAAGERGLNVSVAVAEALPFPDGAFDLVVTSTSFDHWADQLGGLRECRRVLTRGGRLLLVDQFWPPLVARWLPDSRRRARTTARAGRLLTQAGFGSVQWHPVYATVIKAATATAE
jgi:SAM-dependent methyltransferase